MSGTLQKTGWLSWGLTVGAAMVLGFGIGRLSAPESKVEKETSSTVSPGRVVQNENGDVDRGGSEPVAMQNLDSTGDQLRRSLVLTDPKLRNRELENSLSRASLEDVKKALKWAEGLPDSAGKRAAMAKIIERWGQLDGANAVAYAEKLFAETGNPDLLKDAMRGWGQTNPTASLQYAQSMGVSDGLRRDILRDLVRDWADRSPQAAAAYAASNRLELGRGGTTALIADRWSKQDPQTAANWAMSLPPGKEQLRALDELVQNWCDLNLQSAADFVSRQQAGINRDTMVGTLAREVAKQDPASALKWVATIQDGGMQESTGWSIYQRAIRRDPEGAQSMLQSSPLSSALKQSLLEKATSKSNRGGGG
jgi:hypothetical protein